MAKIPIVDRHDQVIGYKERTQINAKLDIYRGASLWVTNSNHEVLLAQRSFSKKLDPGKWGEAVGGTVENHDTYLQTIVREAEEELGLIDLELTEGPKQLIRGPYQYFTQWYFAELDLPLEEFSPQESEVESLQWISAKELVADHNLNPMSYISSMKEIIELFNLS